MSDVNNRPGIGVGVIVLRDGKILIGERTGNHGSGTFMIPGGHIEFGETFEQVAVRETEEETGLKDVKIKSLVSISNNIDYDKHYVSIGMLAESSSGSPYDAEPDKSRNWKWYDMQNLPENIFLPSRRVIDAWLSGKIY